MIGQRFIDSVFPRPRGRLTWRSAWPLALFLLVYGGVCAYLELTNRVLFVQPLAFLLLVFSPWVWWMHIGGYAGLSRGRGAMALLLRLSILGVFVMLLAEPRAVRVRDVVSVVYAVDVSDSIGEKSSDEALTFVARTVVEKPRKDEAGLIVFGHNAAVELPPRPTFLFEGFVNSQIDKDATNLEQSLSLAAAMLPEENQGRIVLISDGTATEGDLARIVDELRSRKVSVDVLPIQYSYADEVWLERLELPQFVKIGESYQAGVVLSSLKEGSGTLVLSENGKPIYEEPVNFQPGKNRYEIAIKLRTPGYYEYKATIQPPVGKDQLPQNNTVINSVYLEGEGRVLVVIDPRGDDRDWQPMVQAMKEGQRAVEVQKAFDFPRDPSSLLPFDCVIFANVPADAFDVIQFQALRDSVFNFGAGFMMVGGANSFGPGGYHRTAVEDALPVSMDVTQKKVLPKGALAIILHTCEFPEGNTWGKRITKQAIKVLGGQDEVGVLAYMRGGEGWMFELTPASNYEKLVPKINGAEIGDMPSFDNTMRLGLEGLKKSDAAAKHMIIISDGDPAAPNPKLLQEYIDNQISVSMVAIFPHGGAEISTMRAVAQATGGRYYFPSDPNELPAIFIKESKTLKRTMIQNKTLTPELGVAHPVLKGIDALPPLHGYVLTTLKSGVRAEGVLNAPPDEKEPGEIDPILAIGRYGLGSTAAFTSDLSPNWGKDWVTWEQYKEFVQQLVTSISRQRKEGHLRLYTHLSGNEAVIVVEDFAPEERFLDVKAAISGPRDRNETISLKQVGPRRYQATVPLWGQGRYNVAVQGNAGEIEELVIGGFIVPYSPEYLRFRSNPIVLTDIAEKTGGEVLARDVKGVDIFNTKREPKRSSQPVFPWFLTALALLIPLDVGLRRVQLEWSIIKGWFGFGHARAPSTATMEALRERKQAVDSELAARRAQRPLETSPPPERARTAAPRRDPQRASGSAATTPTPEAPRADKPAATSGSTTGRLLDLKRKRQQQGEDEQEQT